jgi:hypothetical protein
VAEDLAALRSVSSRDLPPWSDIERAPARTAVAAPGGILMSALRRLKSHPWLSTGLVAAAAAVALLFIPISYQRVTGSNLELAVSGDPGSGEIRRIAGEVREIFQPASIRVAASDADVRLSVEVGDRSWKQVARLAQAYVKGLAARGIAAEARVAPRLETAHGSVYAAAANIIEIRIQSEGKSDAEIAAEIQSQMAAAGVPDAEVEVHTDGDRRQIGVMIRRERGPDDPPEPEGECANFRISVDGQEPNDPDEKRVEVRLHRTPEMTDEDLIAEARRQLDEQGVDADVTIENGRIKITPRE